MCIEFNGEQHFKKIEYWGGETAFLLNNKKDNIKKDYCDKNNIKLLIITNVDDVYDNIKKEIQNITDFDDVYSEYLNFDEAKDMINNLNIKSQSEYNKNYKKGLLLPSHPATIYKNLGWKGWSDFLKK